MKNREMVRKLEDQSVQSQKIEIPERKNREKSGEEGVKYSRKFPRTNGYLLLDWKGPVGIFSTVDQNRPVARIIVEFQNTRNKKGLYKISRKRTK